MKELVCVDDYNYQTWAEYFDNNNVDMRKLHINKSWKNIIRGEIEMDYFKNIEQFIKLSLEKTDGKVKIYPYPKLVFNAFNSVPLQKVNVVILGQDPYFKSDYVQTIDTTIPQAMGLSFSVPTGVELPSSLKNIFANLEKFGHIDNIDKKNGNLQNWAKQGVLLLNTALTVQHGYSNSHGKMWQKFTKNIITYLSDNCNNLIFVLWGLPALDKLEFIDTKKHKTIISSHPSGLSCHKPMRQYMPFMEQDHFGKINDYRQEMGKSKINWNVSN